MADQAILEAGKKSLKRIQDFDVATLIQSDRLGSTSFGPVAEPAKKLVGLFMQLPETVMEDLGNAEIISITNVSNAAYAIFNEILEFDSDAGDNKSRRDQLVNSVDQAYSNAFSSLYPVIAYAVSRTVDFARLEQRGLATIQAVRDQTERVLNEIEEQKNEGSEILARLREVAAENGVSQMAIYFKGEADKYTSEAAAWRGYTVKTAVGLGIFGLVSLTTHKWSWIAPINAYESIQFTASKIFVFFVLAYMLFFCVKNYLSSRHNEVVNRHRQNALLTYKSLTDAGTTAESRNIVLGHASTAIYGQQETGFGRAMESGVSNTSIVELVSQAAGQ